MTTYPIPSTTYYVLQDLQPIVFTPWIESVMYCGPFAYSLSGHDPSIVSLNIINHSIDVYTEDFLKLGT